MRELCDETVVEKRYASGSVRLEEVKRRHIQGSAGNAGPGQSVIVPTELDQCDVSSIVTGVVTAIALLLFAGAVENVEASPLLTLLTLRALQPWSLGALEPDGSA